MRACFYLATLPTFPVLSASVDPVMSEHVLLTEIETFSCVAKTGSGKTLSHTWTYVSEAARSPLPESWLATKVNLQGNKK